MIGEWGKDVINLDVGGENLNKPVCVHDNTKWLEI